MISENIRISSTMDWNMNTSGSSLQAKNLEFQGLLLEQQFSATHGFSQDHAYSQNLCAYPGNNQTINSPSNTMSAKKLPLHNTGATSALRPIYPSSKRPIAAKGLAPSLSLVQMTPGVIQNSVVVGTLLHGSTGNSLQTIPQKRMNPYNVMGNFNNQSQQICSNSVKTPGYRQVCKNNSSPKNSAAVHYYVNGTVSQMGAAVPLNSSPSHYSHSQQNFSCVILPVGQNLKQINGQNSNMTGTVQSQQYASDHINPAPSTYNNNRNATQISPCNMPNQVTNKNLQAPPPYPVQPVQTNYGQFPLSQTVLNMSAEDLQNYHSPKPNLNDTSYSAYYNQKGQISRETNTVGSTAYNISEQGCENQLSNEPTKSIEFLENLLNNVQPARIGCTDGTLIPQTSQTSEPPKNLNNLKIFSATSSNDKPKITKESLAVDYKKLLKIEYALLKLGESYKKKCKMFLSAEQNEQAAAHNQNLNQSSPGNVTQNEPSHVANPALQFSSLDATQNQSFSPASCDSNQIKDVPLFLKKTDSHLLPVLQSLLEGTADENMLLSCGFVKDCTDQNKQLAINGSSSGNSGKSEYNIKNPVSTSSPRAQLSEMNPIQEPLAHMKNNHAFQNFKINKDAVETLRHNVNRRLHNLVQNPATSCESLAVNKVKEIAERSHQMPSICPTLMQKSVKNFNIESEHVSDASSSASVLSERLPIVQGAGTVQIENHTTSADSFRNGGVCSLEELETSLALWKKSRPESHNGQSCESTQSSVGLSSSEGGNLTSEFIQNDQTQVTFESNGTAQTYVPISRKTHDVSSNLLKGAEPQVAIVTPLMLSKDHVQIAVQNSPVSQNLKEIQDKIGSPSEPVKQCENLDINRKANISSQDSGIVKVETQNSCCFELSQVRNRHSPPELKNLKSELDSGDYFPPDNQVSQKCVPPQIISDLIDSRDIDEVVQNDTVLQISSVCSLVKGDACYNSQIANIFNTSPLTSTIENDTSLKDCVPSLQCNNQQPVIVKTEPEPEISISSTERNILLPSPSILRKAVEDVLKQVPALEMDQSDKTANEMNERNSEEDKKKEKKSMPFPEKKLEQNVSGSDISDFTSDTKELCQNKYDQLSSSVANDLGGIGKDGTAKESEKQVPALELDQSYKTANEINGRNSDEVKKIEKKDITFLEKKHEQNVSGSDVHISDFASHTQELCQNKYDQLSSSVADSLGGIGKEDTAEENKKQFGDNTEAPVTFLSDQLAELSEEFPYGLGYLKTFSETDNNDPVPKLSDPGNNGNFQSSEKFPSSSDAVDQIQIILNSQQSNKVLSEDKQQFSNKSENSESYIKTDSEHKLTSGNVSLKTDTAIDIETVVTSSETPLTRQKKIYCCLQGWLASSFAMEPCACMQVKESTSKQTADLCLQSETTGKDRPKASENCNVDFRLNNQLSTSTLDTVAKKISSEMQSDRTLNKISGDTKAKENKPYTRDQTAPPLQSSEKLTWSKLEQTNVHLEKELLHHVPSQPPKTEMEAVEIDTSRDHVDARRNTSTAEAQHLSNTEDVIAKNLCRSDSSIKQSTEKLDIKLKTDAGRHRPIIIKHSERYKIKWDSSETRMIKGPISNKSLKRQKAMERKRKALAIHHNDVINNSNVSGVGSDFRKHENPQCMPTSHSQEHLNGNKFIINLGKKFGYKKAEYKKPVSSESTDHHSESTENYSECTIPKVKKINLEKYAYSKDIQNAWKCRNLENSKTLTPQKQRMRPFKTSKVFSPCKEAMLDVNKREKRVERSLSDKMSCFSRRTGKLSISLHREPKKTYLNRVAFKRTTHKTICLTNLEPWHSRWDWQVKSSSLSGWSKDNSQSSSSPQKPEENKPAIQFKTCPDILFRNPVIEEQVLDEENPSEKGKTLITAIKSKREDWIMGAPAKRKKTEENKPQVDEEIPLETAIKLLETNETFSMPLKETTYETYRKMHLEKSRSLDSSPVN